MGRRWKMGWRLVRSLGRNGRGLLRILILNSLCDIFVFIWVCIIGLINRKGNIK
jgi:hypothetical protein